MSKLVKRMPWDEDPDGGRSRTPMTIDDLPEDMRHLLAIRPRRNPRVEWEDDAETGLVTLVYAKNLSTVERALGKVFKPVEEIRRPLDAPGSDIWRLCDGSNDIATICTAIDDFYKEEMEPVLRRVVGYIEILAQRGLVILGRDPDQGR
jgi:hypothetical protein